MRLTRPALCVLVVSSFLCCPSSGQEYGPADRGQPGDEMIQRYLARCTQQIHEEFLPEVKSADDWKQARLRYRDEYYYMLGLSPMPSKSPLKATVTGTLPGDGYAVEMLHYQSRPGLYVTANLYRPAKVPPGERLPAVLYVCGHSSRGRSGNKTAFQSHGIWFARHGYVCLMVDTLQLGEIGALHHGTYRQQRWWWHSRGYTPAGVECLNGIRGIDYLSGRDDVDPQRIAVTGISGGGAASFWIAAADQRVKVAVPVSGMADLPSYVTNRVINGHCDCMFLYNTFRWPWTRIAALVAPRPLLFVNSDHDRIFPMDANHRVINRLERVYSLFGAGELVDAVVSIGGHAYRRDVRQAAYRFINLHLKNDPRIVSDSEVDLVAGSGAKRQHPIAPERLRVFPQDSDIPKDELNTTIDEHFVPMAKVWPQQGRFPQWSESLQSELRRVVFGCFPQFPQVIPAAELLEQVNPQEARLGTEPGIEIRLFFDVNSKPAGAVKGVALLVRGPDVGADAAPDRRWRAVHHPDYEVYHCHPRGVGRTAWTRKNPPNYVQRCHVLLGRTVDTGRVWDVIATARYLHAKHEGKVPVYVHGQSGAGVLAAYAALWEPEIAGVVLDRPPLTHMDDAAPQFLGVLRVCDVPDVLGMLAPRPLSIRGVSRDKLAKVVASYATAGRPDRLVIRAD